MIKKLDDNAECSRNWIGNDRVNQHYYARIRLNESPLSLGLQWKELDDSPKRLVGKYNLDLKSLLNKKFIRIVDGCPGEVILRFQRTDDGQIQIAINRKAPALSIGVFKA
ncbi:MAG: hypothetical protein A2283_19000 [Lentisphaerae bacterium RIFOXYA12_FULL_48_11]|nr:MAG: hypothetical protein A2283_19000 [Lentisphaerae bacterium RIFOXYA12_FULL_48_11]